MHILTEAERRAIRIIVTRASAKLIAKRYGVDKKTIMDILQERRK